MTDSLFASAFHARTAALNQANAWVECNGVTVPAVYSSPNEEVLAARTRVGLSDLAQRRQTMLEGPRVVAFLQELLTRDASSLTLGQAFKALWLADGGGVRGAAAVARPGKESFWLVSAASDAAWIGDSARLFDVRVRDISSERCGLAVMGPYAHVTLEGAGIPSDLDASAFRATTWRGSEIIVSRFGELGGYEVWSIPDDALLVWDRIVQAGAAFGIEPVGSKAMDVLDIEVGVPRPRRDYVPATDGGAAEPSPAAFGLGSLVDPAHTTFNGRAGFLKSRETRKLAGVEIDSDTPAPHAQLTAGGECIGHTLSSCYSPTLRRAIALAEIEEWTAKPGTRLELTLPPSLQTPGLRTSGATVVALPFLEQPVCLPA
jgi:aminomethyltransferase